MALRWFCRVDELQKQLGRWKSSCLSDSGERGFRLFLVRQQYARVRVVLTRDLDERDHHGFFGGFGIFHHRISVRAASLRFCSMVRPFSMVT